LAPGGGRQRREALAAAIEFLTRGTSGGSAFKSCAAQRTPRRRRDLRAQRRAVRLVATRIPAVRDHAGVSHGGLGLALACLAAGSIVAMPVAGGLAARHGSPPVVRAGIVALAVSGGLVALAPSLIALCLLCALLGASTGWLDVSMNAHGVTVERAAARPLLSGLHAAFSAGGLLGAGLGALAAGAAVDARVQLALTGALVLVAGLACARALLPPSADAAGARAGTRAPAT